VEKTEGYPKFTWKMALKGCCYLRHWGYVIVVVCLSVSSFAQKLLN